MKVIINGQQTVVGEETTILEVARREGIWIPTYCYHPGLPPYGACRLCLVEIKAGGRPGLTASCTLPVSDGLVVETDSPRVMDRRRMLIRLMLAATPGAKAVRDLARRLGAEETPFPTLPAARENCGLCGLCVRVCQQVGANAIGFAFRGSRRKVTPPFGKPSAACLGCTACANVCPNEEVRFNESGERIFSDTWQADLKLAKCESCGRLFTPQPLYDFVNKKLGPDFNHDRLCPSCKKRRLGSELAGAITGTDLVR